MTKIAPDFCTFCVLAMTRRAAGMSIMVNPNVDSAQSDVS